MATSLSRPHRKLLETTTKHARVLAESASRAALENLAVHERDYRAHMTAEQRLLRSRLRARGRALGDIRDERAGTQEIRHLTQLAAYENWHRLLFTRFLTENHLLFSDESLSNVRITLEECEELAPEFGARDGLDLACRFASRTLPGVFRRDDPVLELSLALNNQVELRNLLGALPRECFLADDALGWTYQFWQVQRKDEVNASGKKIGADELAPVTQLFTEDYMVEFLLHNTIGAWWAGKVGPIIASTEADARAQVSLPALSDAPEITWTYLRFVQDEATQTWLPAAGSFEGWPKAARDIRVLDPCMGSGHFLVFALPLLVRLRVEEEQLSPRAAVAAVLYENIHGLELDERCTQIAAFNVALTAWKLVGYQELPPLNLACSGLTPRATEAEWAGLAGNNERLRMGMARLHQLFRYAPDLGSLIDPHALPEDMFVAEFHELAPLLQQSLSTVETASRGSNRDDTLELAVIAQGITKAAELLASGFTLVATNVPYLGRGKQDDILKNYCDRLHPNAKADLATCFIERAYRFCVENGSIAVVTPQSWLFLKGYSKFRQYLLVNASLNFLARLGTSAFESITGEIVSISLAIVSQVKPRRHSHFQTLDVSSLSTVSEKSLGISMNGSIGIQQGNQLNNPDYTIRGEEYSKGSLLGEFALGVHGVNTKDGVRFIRVFWELSELGSDWSPGQTTTEQSCDFGGGRNVYFWQSGSGILQKLYKSGVAILAGSLAWGKRGILVSQMGSLPVSLYAGTLFDQNSAVIVPKTPAHLPAIWAFCRSGQFNLEVRKIDQSIKVTNNTLVKVPFDLHHWGRIAEEQYPTGLPSLHSVEPTQWLFNGHPHRSTQPLHVAVARLVGYHWPRQTGSSFPDCPAIDPDGLESLTDEDGIVCLPPVNREQPAADRLRRFLTAALGKFDERALVSSAGPRGSASTTIEEWLRDEFFEQHSKLFHDRPFIWHIWDGRTDGFHALVNYHRLDHAALQKLTYSHLGNWIQQQSEDARANVPGAALRLGAAEKLVSKLSAILEGEAPLDIFVRWKSLKQQSLGWHPDLNDGIRQNIRPFLLAGDVGKKGAGLFRTLPLSLKDNDRGTELPRAKAEYPWFWCDTNPGTNPTGGEEFVGTRWNDVHFTLERKRKT